MRFDIMTLFPEAVRAMLDSSITGRAQKNGYIEVNTYNIRDYAYNKHKSVDDTPYGGGYGMLMATMPIYECYSAVIAGRTDRRRVIYMSPKGGVLTQNKAKELMSYDGLVILCGHYEGIDERIIDEIVDEEISIGDFVLTGGELPACVLVDCIARMVDGVLPSSECYEDESIAGGLLEYPQYTRPYEFLGVCVPDVLISGNHEKIREWRLEESLRITKERRPDMYEKYIEEHPLVLKKRVKRENKEKTESDGFYEEKE